MADFTLKHLRYFEALARHQHFGRAADHSAISQPALSMQIKELEQIVGTALFERSARAVRLTAMGEQFSVRARAILQAVDDLGGLARSNQNTLTGRLRLGSYRQSHPYFLPSMIHTLGKTHPALELQVRETTTPRLIQELQDGVIDAAILALPLQEPSFTETILFEEDFVLVRPIAETGNPTPASNQLRDMRLLLLEKGIAFVIRPWPIAASQAHARGMDWTVVPLLRWSRWSALAWV